MSAEFIAIIELLETAGVGAVWCFAGYLLYQLLVVILVLTGLRAIARITCSCINCNYGKASRAYQYMKHLRDTLNIGRPGSLGSSEQDKVERKINKMITENKESEDGGN